MCVIREFVAWNVCVRLKEWSKRGDARCTHYTYHATHQSFDECESGVRVRDSESMGIDCVILVISREWVRVYSIYLPCLENQIWYHHIFDWYVRIHIHKNWNSLPFALFYTHSTTEFMCYESKNRLATQICTHSTNRVIIIISPKLSKTRQKRGRGTRIQSNAVLFVLLESMELFSIWTCSTIHYIMYVLALKNTELAFLFLLLARSLSFMCITLVLHSTGANFNRFLTSCMHTPRR